MARAACTLLVLALAAAGAAAAPSPPAWACGTQTDYYAKTTTVCAPSTCNAAQRNLGGDLLVLDRQSYGTKSCQGCNPDIPATCCKACQETDNCNAWVVCTNKDGCGSGCSSYAKQFKFTPLNYYDKLPHKFWGNWGGCQGDKWPFGMCSLKVVDTKKAPVTGTDAKEGWVSGIVPKTAADPKCPPNLSAKTCKSCLSSKNATLCFECVKNVNSLAAPGRCTTCASLPSRKGQEACAACVAGAKGNGPNDCAACLDTDCSDADCMNKRNEDPTKAPNLGSVDQCFACVTGSPSKIVGCTNCFQSWNVPLANRAACLSCVAGSPPAAGAGCAGCAGQNVKDGKGCQECLKKAKTEGSAKACGACSDANNVPAQYFAGCVACALGPANDDAKSYCANLDSETTKAAVDGLYGCLAKGLHGGNCWQCYRNTPDMSVTNKCYECLPKVSKANGITCTNCWTKGKVTDKKAAACETCLLQKDKAKQDPFSCAN